MESGKLISISTFHFPLSFIKIYRDCFSIFAGEVVESLSVAAFRKKPKKISAPIKITIARVPKAHITPRYDFAVSSLTTLSSPPTFITSFDIFVPPP